MNHAPASHLIPLKLTDDQFRWLENAVRFLENETGCKVTEASIVLRIMQYGLGAFEKELAELRARSNEGRKRFGRLHLAYSRIERPESPQPLGV